MAQTGAYGARGILYFAALAAMLAVSTEAAAQRPSLRGKQSRDGGDDRTAAETTGSSSRRGEEKEASSRKSKSAAVKFAIDEFSPRGPAPAGAVISVTFTDDVVTSADLEQGKTPESVFSFEPSVEGALQWESPRQVRFLPARPLLKGTEYIARINPLL